MTRDNLSPSLSEKVLPSNTPIWHTESQPQTQRLTGDISCEVCVVGGGVVGLACAYELMRRGIDVVLLDAGKGTSGQTSRSTAHLVTALDERYFTLEETHGEDITRAAAQQHTRAIDWMEKLIAEAGIDCGFARIDGLLVLDNTHAHHAELLIKKESDAARKARIPHSYIQLTSDIITRGFYECGLRFPGQARVDPMKFLDGLSRALHRGGVRVFSFERVTDVVPGVHDVRLNTSTDHTVKASYVIMATHDLPPELKPGLRDTTLHASFVVAFEDNNVIQDAELTTQIQPESTTNGATAANIGLSNLTLDDLTLDSTSTQYSQQNNGNDGELQRNDNGHAQSQSSQNNTLHNQSVTKNSSNWDHLLWDGYWGDSSPYHYVRTANITPGIYPNVTSSRCLIIGGEDVEVDKLSDVPERYDLIELWARQHFPHAGPRIGAWWGVIAEPDGEFPLIGEIPSAKRVFAVTGDSGNGFTYAAIAAVRLGELIQGKPTPEIENVMFAMTKQTLGHPA